jgi:hypothetical protein
MRDREDGPPTDEVVIPHWGPAESCSYGDGVTCGRCKAPDAPLCWARGGAA